MPVTKYEPQQDQQTTLEKARESLQEVQDEQPFPEPTTLAELNSNPPPKPPVLIEGLLYQTGKMIFIGASKARKTFSLFDIGIAISGGGDWFGHRCARGPVLFINFELMDFEAHDRAYRIANARDIDAGSNLHIWNLRGYRATLDKIRNQLLGYCKRNNVTTIIADPWYKLQNGGDQNSNDDVAEALAQISDVAREAGASFIFSHHSPKGDLSKRDLLDLASGAGTFARDPDLIVGLRETDDSTDQIPRAKMEFVVRSFAPASPFIIRWNYPVWELDPTGSTKLKTAGRPQKHVPDDILKHLSDKWKPLKVWKMDAKISPSTFDRLKKEIEEQIESKKVGREMMFRKRTS